MSFGKGSSNTSSNQSQNETSSQTETPNNLGALQQGWSSASDLLSGGNSAYNQALALLTGNANAASSAANGATTTAAGYAAPGATTNAANSYLTPMANGSLTGTNNPYIQNVVNQLSQQLQGSTDGGFAAAGRYGSGANANAFNTALANEAGQLDYANYNDSANRQLQAANQLSTNNSNSTNQALAALGIIPSLTNASTNAGASAVGAATNPSTTYANILSLLGPGGGTVNGTSSGTASGTQTGSQNSMGVNLENSTGPGSILGTILGWL